MEDRLTATLRQDLQSALPQLYAGAQRVAKVGLVKYGETDAAAKFPPTCPYTLDQILAEDWYPEPPGEAK